MPPTYEGPIVDAHHHLWDRASGLHPWLEGQGGRLAGNCLPADYVAAAAGHNVIATVHVEAGWADTDPFGEIAWLDALPRPDWMALRYVAQARLDADDAEAVLERHADHSRIVGVRDILSWHPDPARSHSRLRHRMSSPAFRQGFTALDRLGLAFDLLISPWQMAEAEQLARAFPATSFIINHCGSPFDQSPDGLAYWRQGLGRLAALPNVAIKVSDIVAYRPDSRPESLEPIVLACIEAFGPARTLLASDHPVVECVASFAETYSVFSAILAGFSRDERRAMFAANAARLYRLPIVC